MKSWLISIIVALAATFSAPCAFGQAPVIPCVSIAAGGCGTPTQFHLIAANTNNSTLIAAGARTVTGAQLSGVGAAPAYVKLYNKATAPTCGTDTPVKVLMIPAAATAANGAVSNVSISLGSLFPLGLGLCVVTGMAAANTFNVNIDHR